MTSFLDSHQSAAAVNKKLRFETSHEPILVILYIELVREELSRRGSDWQYIFEMEHLPLHPTKPSLIEGRYPTVGHFEGKMFSSWACEPGCYSTKPVLK